MPGLFHYLRQNGTRKHLGYWGLLLLFLGTSVLFLALFLPLPSPQIPVASEVYDRDHRFVTTFYFQNRRPVPLTEIPAFLQQAFLAVEDHRFYQHHGLNPGRVLKAVLKNISRKSLVEGASTITQQLARNIYLNQDRNFIRKIKELFFAVKLELHLSKNQILELYLNQIYFGHSAYGIKTAAETYFGRDLGSLNQAEMALLAGLTRGPAFYSPYRHPEAARQRLQSVLKRMEACKMITADEYTAYSRQPLRLPGLQPKNKLAPYFLDLLQDEIDTIFPKSPGLIYQAGLKIETTLDMNMQKQAERVLKNDLPRLQKDKSGIMQPQGALLALDPKTGAILALVGGTDFSTSQFNRAVQAKRQPGSAFKPFLFATALTQGYTLASLIDRSPVSYPLGATVYRPLDHGDENASGMLSLRAALAGSSNVVSVKLLDHLGIPALIDFATNMGISSSLPRQLSLALGSGEVSPLELAAAYLPFANGGYKHHPTTILRILDRHGRVLYQAEPRAEKVLNPGVAFLVTQALTGVFAKGGTASNIGARIRYPAAGKTGTTQDNHDAWFVGYTPELLACVYVGCDHHERSLPGGANHIAAPLWANFMNVALAKHPPQDFPTPEEVVKTTICRETGALATPFCASYSEYFLSGTEPAAFCPKHRLVELEICRRSGLLPGPYCRDRERKQFLLGRQPVDTCEDCGPVDFFFDWFQNLLHRKRPR